MATIVGRTPCPDCGFEHAHIKASEGKQPYRHCPECGLMTQARNGAQARLLLAKARPIDASSSSTPPAPPATTTPIVVPSTPPAAPPPPSPAKKANLWDQLTKGAKP